MHIAFCAPRTWVEELQAALSDERLIEATLARWWTRREARLDVATTPFREWSRRSLLRHLEPESAPLVRTAPVRVRRMALHTAHRLAPRISALRKLNAPEIIVGHQRRTLLRALGELDPAAPRQPEPTPSTDGEHRLRLFLQYMLMAAQCDAPSLPVSGLLPRRFEVDGQPVLAEASGPVTYALAGDVRALEADEALIAFDWVENDAAGDWDPLRI